MNKVKLIKRTKGNKNSNRYIEQKLDRITKILYTLVNK